MRAPIRTGLLSALLAAICLSAPGTATAAPQGAWWHLTQRGVPSQIEPGGEGTIIVQGINVGGVSTSGTLEVSDTLPQGVAIQGVEYFATSFEGFDLGPGGFFGAFELCEVEPHRVSCSSQGTVEGEAVELVPPLIPFGFLELRIHVTAEAGAQSGVSELAAAGASMPAAHLGRRLTVGAGQASFGPEELSLVPEEEGGAVDTRAGSHPYQLTNTFALNRANAATFDPPALVRNLHFDLPAGQIGNPRALAQCSDLQFANLHAGGNVNFCPSDSALGVALITASIAPGSEATYTVPLFNLTPAEGEPARFGFEFAGNPVILDTAVRSGIHGGQSEDYGVTIDVSNITQSANLFSATTIFWGAPGDESHNQSRGWGCVEGGHWGSEAGIPCEASDTPGPTAFLTLPTDCAGPYGITASGESWPTVNAAPASAFGFSGFPYSLEDGVGTPLAISGCNQLPFAPKIDSQPTSRAPSSPTGLNFELNFENEGLLRPQALAESQVKKAVVTLPAGVTTNPAVANGLGACTLAQYEAESLEGAGGCPSSSKVGEFEIESPLVEPTIEGSIYVAAQHDNPAHNLLSIYMVAKSPELGVLVRAPGAVTPDPQTGQLTTVFDNLPQLPFSHFELHFREGPRAPLIAPGLCGTYTTQADLYPWSQPTVPVHREAGFSVSEPCPSSSDQEPNQPKIQAGSASPIAGAYSPFDFEVSREDGSQLFSQISATLPEGLLGKLAGVPYCSEAAIGQAESRSGEGQGALELASPSCPAASQVGVVTVGAGAGSQPYYVQGKAYLAGPYKGAPLSLAIITPAIAGPFDLGTVVVRTALFVDETTAQIHAVSDPLPTILHGLPLVVRSVDLDMNRPGFTLNPTSCEPKQITGQAISTLGSVAPLAQRFQVGACGALGFKPSLKLSLKGATRRTGVPALKAVLTYPKGNYANIKSVSTVLPKSEYIDQAHIGNVCTRVQFNAGAGQGAECPKRSVLGHAKAWSPLLDQPLEGTVYLRSNGSERELPDIVVALKGQIPVTLVGFVDSVKKNRHSEVSRLRTRFVNVPDAPVSRFVLQLAGAKHGLLENSANLCRVKNVAQVKMTAQNGKAFDIEPSLANDCGKSSKRRRGAR